MKATLWLALFGLGGPALGLAQGVTIAPTTIFMDVRSRTASLLLANPNTDPAEVEISTLFGYTATDSAGRIVLDSVMPADSAPRSAAGWIRAYPRRMTIAPGAYQTVRLLVSPPAGSADGEYWARLLVTARGGRLPVTATTDSSSVQIDLKMEVRSLLPVIVRKGEPVSGIHLDRVRAAVRGDSLEVRVRLQRRGNAAAFATVRGELVDAAGAVRASFSSPVATYYTLEPRFTAPASALAPGAYRLRLTVSPGRSDIPPSSVLRFDAVRDSVMVRVP